MFLLIAAAGLCLLTLIGLSRGIVGGGRMILVGFDGVGVLAGFVVTVAAATVFGPINGLSLVVALLLHELGHYVGARLCGRTEAPFRLLPAFGSLRPDDSDFGHDGDRFFHALMGAGLSVGPMLLAVALWQVLQGIEPQAAGFFRALALSIALVNTLNLMPFQPLDGGRCIEIISRALSPSILYLATATAIAGLALMGYLASTVGALMFALAGLLFLILRSPERVGTVALSAREARLAFLAYAGTFGAHLTGGLLVLQAYQV